MNVEITLGYFIGIYLRKPIHVFTFFNIQAYEVERGSQFSLAQGFTTKHWIGTAGVVLVMMMAAGIIIIPTHSFWINLPW